MSYTNKWEAKSCFVCTPYHGIGKQWFLCTTSSSVGTKVQSPKHQDAVTAKSSTAKSLEDVYQTTLNVFVFQVLVSLVLTGQLLVLSLPDRKNTNAFVSEMVLLLSTYMLLIRSIGAGVVSAENACFCLQFCSCYFFSVTLFASQQTGNCCWAKQLYRPQVWLLCVCFLLCLVTYLRTACISLPMCFSSCFRGRFQHVCTPFYPMWLYIESIVDSVYVHFM
jgi:hypothetical protein